MSLFASPDEPRRDTDATAPGGVTTDSHASVPAPDGASYRPPAAPPAYGAAVDQGEPSRVPAPPARPTGEGALFDAPVANPAPGAEYVVPPTPFRPSAPTRPRGRTVAAIAVGSLLLGLGGGVGGAAAWLQWGPDAGSASTVSTLPVSSSGTTEDRAEGSVAAVAAAAMPSVVQIETATAQGGATGSGVVIRADGYILTNNHVVADATGGNVTVLFSDGHKEAATVVGTSEDYDLAVVHVQDAELTPLVLGDSDAMVVGDDVIAIGSPLGLDSTVTTGIVSALNRAVTTTQSDGVSAFMAAIQTDAAINPGNSGGPLLNMAGEVIGINSAIAALPGATQASGAGSVGLGFAIPSNQARRVAEEIIATGSASVPVVGAQLDTSYTGEGVRVADSSQLGDAGPGIIAGSPADNAGMREGDIITAVDGVTVADADTVVVMIRSHAVGDDVTFTIERDGDTFDVTATLGSASGIFEQQQQQQQ